ncbi:MAG: hypothetical protein ACRCXT_10570 [Paraclostridium sp.]
MSDKIKDMFISKKQSNKSDNNNSKTSGMFMSKKYETRSIGQSKDMFKSDNIVLEHITIDSIKNRSK